MFRRRPGRMATVFVLAALLSPAIAQALPFFQGSGRTVEPSLFERVWSLLAAVWGENGGQLDPSGITGDNGGKLDPSGLTGDNGGKLDPHG